MSETYPGHQCNAGCSGSCSYLEANLRAEASALREALRECVEALEDAIKATDRHSPWPESVFARLASAKSLRLERKDGDLGT